MISGTGLAGTTGVTIGGAPATVVGTPTDTRVTVTVTATATTPAGSVANADVAVTGPGGTIVAADAYEYLPVPAVTGSTPGSGPVTGGAPVTVTGDGFVRGGTTVTIYGITFATADVAVPQASRYWR
ncbi:hypothetical protein ASF23_16870 [Curtobacterium sp. Leaf261]|nr:hypothetical protein ASF23_16870 [Curtobacterium sp. Leaf261]